MTFLECCQTVREHGLRMIRPREHTPGLYDIREPFEAGAGWVWLDATTANVVCQIFAVNSESICLPGCIYISKDNHISQSQSIGELIPECFGTGISMRLEDTDNTTVRIIACSSQCCSNLCRMMCIIINDSDAAEFSFVFESSGSTAESLQTADDGVCINTGFCRKCDSSQCVGDIVSARNV